MNWLLPEYISDALPSEAWQIERTREQLLRLFYQRGYRLVIPPMVEYLDSLLTGAGSDLKLRTFKLVDQLSGRTLGIRADMTTQVSRIDAHLLNETGVTRLCYCGSVLHTLPATSAASRELIQFGAEIYGYSGLDADIEVIQLMSSAIKSCGISSIRFDISHVGIFRSLIANAGVSSGLEADILQAMTAKDMSSLQSLCANISEPYKSALMVLPTLYGDIGSVSRAKQVLPDIPEIIAALNDLTALQSNLPDLVLSFDLGDLRGYHYHNGVVFAAYCDGKPNAVGHGGRYDGAGEHFGRARSATGFSFDLRTLVGLRQSQELEQPVVIAPSVRHDHKLQGLLASLRNEGKIVLEILPGEEVSERMKVDHQITQVAGEWVVQECKGRK